MREPVSNPLVEFLSKERLGFTRLLIVTHDHPDPDSIASAWTLAYLAENLGKVRSTLVYGGVIGRKENQTLVRMLRVPIQPLRARHLAKAPHVATVDTQPVFQNNSLPATQRMTIIIDHHARNPKTKAEFILIDESAGATATLLSEALFASGLEIPARLATALLYGIASETQHLGREAGPRDIAAYKTLFPKVSMYTLSRIENPPRARTFFLTLGKAIYKAYVLKRVIGVHLGDVASQDLVSQMADFLLTHENMSWSIATGRYNDHLHVSLRTRNRRAKAGRLLRRLLGGGTAAGGHGMIAGGAISVGKGADEATWTAIEQKLTGAFLRSQGHKEPHDLQYPFRVIDTPPVPALKPKATPKPKPARDPKANKVSA